MTVHMRDEGPQRPVFVRHVRQSLATAQAQAVSHGWATLVMFVGGRAELEQRGRITLSAGDLLLLPAGEAHRMLRAEDAEAWGLSFDPVGVVGTDIGALVEPFERVRDGGRAVLRLAAGREEHLRGLLCELQREAERPLGVAQAQVQRSLLTLALAEVARAEAAGGIVGAARAGGPPIVAQALRFIERNCLGPLSLRDVAAALGRSPAHLTTALRRATGRTAQQWIVAGRLAEARRSLLFGDEAIAAIAERVGVGDPTHFIRMFRRAHGVTPAAWRTAQRAAAQAS